MARIGSLLLSLLILLFAGCAKVPLTGRTQMALLPESILVEMSLASYGEFLNENKLSADAAATAMVERTGIRIATAVEQYLKENGFADRLNNLKWEFKLVDNDVPNAWAMPGGKVVFYTGILPLTQTEAGLAVVMGHEIAHAVARHGNERMSQAMVLQLGGIALSEALKEKPEATRAIFLSAYGIGGQLGVMLPYSRRHEYEADELGLIFMAMAGYHPEEAVNFWTRMSELPGNRPPEFLSTHPVDKKRIQNIQKIMPKVMQYYRP